MKNLILLIGCLIPLIYVTTIFTKTSTDYFITNNKVIVKNSVNPELSSGKLDSVIVVFNDSNLEQAVREALGIPAGNIYDTDMATLTSFTADNDTISDLTGLEYAVNLTVLNLSNNQISNITALQNLISLNTLYLSNNQISDLSILPSTSLLKELYLNNNQISDLTGIQNLPGLESINISSNQVSDLTPLQTITSLKRLYFSRNLVSDISVVQYLTNINILDGSRNQIKDITVLQNLTNLEQLSLKENQIRDITALQNLTNLYYLLLNSNQINDVSVLQNLSILSRLFLNNNQLYNITELQNLTNLFELGITNNQIRDITALQNLTDLSRLYINSNLFDNEDLNDLYNLDSLTNLQLKWNKGIISGTAIQSLADNLNKINCEDIEWEGTCGVDPSLAVICWCDPSDSVNVEQTVTVQATATDSNQARIQIKIDWGDGNVSDYSELKANAATFEFTHSYSADGYYDIKVLARNEFGVEMDWSESYALFVCETTTSAETEMRHLNNFLLCQNYPNPFNPHTTISYQLPKYVKVNVSIYNSLGQIVKVLKNKYQPAGSYSVQWDGKDDNGISLSSGIYICRIQALEFTQSIKLVLLK